MGRRKEKDIVHKFEGELHLIAAKLLFLLRIELVIKSAFLLIFRQ